MIPALSLLLMSAMMFDAPGSEDNVYLVMFVAAMTSYPFLAVISVVGSWIAWVFKPQSKILQWIFALLPMLSVLASGAAMALIVVICDGQFVCK